MHSKLHSRFLLTLALCLSLLPFPSPDAHALSFRRPPYAAQSAGKWRGRPLWKGARFTEGDRARAIHRGMRFIYGTALDERNFESYGSDYLWCFYSVGASVSDAVTRRMARRMGRERARAWRREHRELPPDADAATVLDYAFGNDAADSLGVGDGGKLKAQLRRAAARFKASDFLLFDPSSEPPPGDVPDACEFDRVESPRGSTSCRVCRRPLRMRSRYDVWYDALITTYTGGRAGVRLGAAYADVLKWLPSMRPYRGSEGGANAEFYDTVYAITHVVYTLNDYGQRRLSPQRLPQEFEFLRANLREAIAQNDADMLGEFMDSLRAFGLDEDDPEIRAGMEYLLARQNADGSWGNVAEKDIYMRYHPTWNAVAALSEYAWRGQSLSSPERRYFFDR